MSWLAGVSSRAWIRIGSAFFRFGSLVLTTTWGVCCADR